MTKATEEDVADLVMDGNDPTEPGEIKVVKGTLSVLDDCDSDDQWSVESGAGVTIVESSYSPYEGTKCLRIHVPPSTTGIIKLTKATGSWDLSLNKYLSYFIRRATALLSDSIHFKTYFGETTYNEQNSGTHFTITPNIWVSKSWDISAIAAASRNAITLFALEVENLSAVLNAGVTLDYVFSEPGPSQLKHFDGDRVYIDSPKVMVDTWEGTGAAKLVTLNRKGVPVFIRIIDIDTPNVPLIWMKGMEESSMQEDGIPSYTASHGGIYHVIDGSFTVHETYTPNGKTILYMVLWED